MSETLIGHRQAISNWLRQFKTIVDPTRRTYKIQESFLGVFKWGEFKNLPKLDYILVFRTFFAKCEACSMDGSEDNPNSYFQVSLVYNKRHRIIVHETKNKSEAREFGHTLASLLHAQLKDSANNPA